MKFAAYLIIVEFHQLDKGSENQQLLCGSTYQESIAETLSI
jgi:hypothetical protein